MDNIVLKERELFSHVTMSIQIKKDWRVKIGLFFIKLGCWISGVNLVNEFPMSIIQNNKPVEVE